MVKLKTDAKILWVLLYFSVKEDGSGVTPVTFDL